MAEEIKVDSSFLLLQTITVPDPLRDFMAVMLIEWLDWDRFTASRELWVTVEQLKTFPFDDRGRSSWMGFVKQRLGENSREDFAKAWDDFAGWIKEVTRQAEAIESGNMGEFTFGREFRICFDIVE